MVAKMNAAATTSPKNASPKQLSKKRMHTKWQSIGRDKLLTWCQEHKVEGSQEFDGTSPKKRILSAWVDHLYANKIDYAKLKGPELGDKIEYGKEEEHEEEEVPEDED